MSFNFFQRWVVFPCPPGEWSFRVLVVQSGQCHCSIKCSLWLLLFFFFGVSSRQGQDFSKQGAAKALLRWEDGITQCCAGSWNGQASGKPPLIHIYSLSCISMDTVTIVQSCLITQSLYKCIFSYSLWAERVQLKFQQELCCDSGRQGPVEGPRAESWPPLQLIPKRSCPEPKENPTWHLHPPERAGTACRGKGRRSAAVSSQCPGGRLHFPGKGRMGGFRSDVFLLQSCWFTSAGFPGCSWKGSAPRSPGLQWILGPLLQQGTGVAPRAWGFSAAKPSPEASAAPASVNGPQTQGAEAEVVKGAKLSVS